MAGEQSKALRRSGVEDIGDHAAVDHYPEVPDKVLRRRAEQNKQADDHPIELQERGEGGDDIHHANGHDRHTEEYQPVMQAVYRQYRENLAIKSQVEKDTDIASKENQISRAAEERPTQRQ